MTTVDALFDEAVRALNTLVCHALAHNINLHAGCWPEVIEADYLINTARDTHLPERENQ